MATIDDFAKLEITLGEVKEAEYVPETDKLLRLVVDFGEEEPRQIVSGIRSRIESPEELIGKQFPFVTNLEPREIKGLTSQGMILVPHEAGFLTPTENLAPGTRIG